MYKVMIVEDEIPIRNIISRIINWNQLGFDLVYEADNGQVALSYLEENQIDLVITDISMPFMDGLELCKNIRKFLPSITIIILTGHNDFNYAQRAIELNVSNYLLKPITKTSFNETLTKVKVDMDKRFANQKDLTFLRKQYEKSKEFLVNKYLMNLILGYSHGSNFLLPNELGLNLDANFYMVGVMLLEDNLKSESEFWGKDRPLLEFAIYNLTKELLDNINQEIIFFGPGNEICIIIKSNSLPNNDFINSLTVVLEDITTQINKLFHIDATVGLSDSYSNLEELSFAYQDATTALEYQVLEGNEKVILKSNVEKKSSFAFHKIEEQLTRLEYSIKVGDLDSLRKVISYIFSVINYENIDIEGFRTMLLKMTMSIFKAYNDIKQVDHQDSVLDYSIFSKVFEINDFNEIKNYYITLCETLSTRIQDMRKTEEQGHVDAAITYIEENYSDPYLGIESLCKKLYLSPGHFSRLFKKTTGETFVDYLTRVRMDQAKNLLANTNEKMYKISRDIGYEDPNYFSYNFKKHVRLTPSEWRKKGH